MSTMNAIKKTSAVRGATSLPPWSSKSTKSTDQQLLRWSLQDPNFKFKDYDYFYTRLIVQ